MKNSIKEWYAERLPGVPKDLLEEAVSNYKADPCVAMSNIVIFHLSGGNLVAHALHIYSKGCGSFSGDFEIQGHWVRVQNKYIFSKTAGCCRFTRQRGTDEWKPAVWREPAFSPSWRVANYPGSYGAYYEENDLENFFFKGILEITTRRDSLFRVLKCALKRPNAEYLIKQGFATLVINEFLENNKKYVNWKSNNLKTMLSLNKVELKLFKETKTQFYYWEYIEIRNKYPKLSPDMIMEACRTFDSPAKLPELLEELNRYRHVTVTKLITYLSGIKSYFYTDYLRQCKELEYDLRDSKHMFPHDLLAVHTELSRLIKCKEDEKLQLENESRNEERKILLFETEDLLIRLPNSLKEIYEEGRILDHCVGSYAERHAKGKLTIVFLRLKNKPDIPYYTMEISTQMKIVQCYGFRNNATVPKPENVKQFETAYQQYLDLLKMKNERKKVS